MPAPTPTFSTTVDSDDESISSFETSGVTLGFVDGKLSKLQELKETAFCNKIGGHPSFSPILSSAPALSSSACGICERSMPLITQIYAALSSDQVVGSQEGREEWYRVLYIWACVYKDCQRKEGSVRAFRALRRIQTSKKGKEKAVKPTSNPFSFGSTSGGSSTDFGSSIFGSSTANDVANPFSMLSVSSEDVDDAEEDAEENKLEDAQAPASTTANKVSWDITSLPRLPAQYLATSEEPSLPSQSTSEGFQTISRRSSSSSSKPEKGWQGEQYEHQHLTGLDSVYLKFTDTVMVKSDGELSDQVLRYERGGSPLPFCVDESYKKVYKEKKFDVAALEQCDCGSGRVFELQLMPQLVTYLGKEGLLKENEEEMEITWSAVWLFCCAKDCGISDGKEEAWREELVMLQYE